MRSDPARLQVDIAAPTRVEQVACVGAISQGLTQSLLADLSRQSGTVEGLYKAGRIWAEDGDDIVRRDRLAVGEFQPGDIKDSAITQSPFRIGLSTSKPAEQDDAGGGVKEGFHALD